MYIVLHVYGDWQIFIVFAVGECNTVSGWLKHDNMHDMQSFKRLPILSRKPLDFRIEKKIDAWMSQFPQSDLMLKMCTRHLW